MKCSRYLVLLCAVILPPAWAGPSSADMKPYPAAQQGFERMVFRLPPSANENDRKVEILVGKILSVDCKPTRISGNLERRVAEGWGFSYFVLEKVNGPLSTLMACPPDEEAHEAFVPVVGEGFLQRYNSKLPVVTYVPEGFAVRYRIWSAAKQTGEASAE